MTRQPYPYFYYRDYSTLVDATPQAPLTSAGRAPNFPTLMHSILNRPDLSDIVAWMPHGRSWRVLQPREFEARVIPQYFTHSKFSSFVRQANGWGFRRITAGVDRNTYYHPLFLRGLPHLIKLMKRPGVAEKQTLDQEDEPDLHKISELHPLPSVSIKNRRITQEEAVSSSSNGASHLSLPAPPATVSSVSLATMPDEEVTVDEDHVDEEEQSNGSEEEDDASSHGSSSFSSSSREGPPVVPLSIPQLPAEFHCNPEAVSKEYTAGFAMGLAYSRQQFEMLLKVMGSSMQPFVQQQQQEQGGQEGEASSTSSDNSKEDMEDANSDNEQNDDSSQTMDEDTSSSAAPQ